MPKTIKTLLKQTVKPDKVVLWLAEEQFPQKENELPSELLELQNFGLTIKWCTDIRSYKKLIPAFNVKKRLIMNSKYKNITNEKDNNGGERKTEETSTEESIIYEENSNVKIPVVKQKYIFKKGETQWQKFISFLRLISEHPQAELCLQNLTEIKSN